MTTSLKTAALALATGLAALSVAAFAQTAPKTADPAVVDAFIKATFGHSSPEWLARIEPDDTLRACNAFHNEVPSEEANKILAREMARVVYPADGKFLGDWKSGRKIADNGRGGQFSDKPDTVSGGNCYACHQLEKAEVSFGTLGPSLTNYGKDRKYAPEEIKTTFTKIYNSQAVVPCSNMPRFGTNKVLNEQQIKDLLALLFDPESPVNKSASRHKEQT